MTVGSINVETLKEWMKTGSVTLVDVREPNEWDAGRIEGATLIPLATVSAQLMPRVADKKLVIYCRSGRRSQTACELVNYQDPTLDPYNLEGGILAWEASAQK